MAGMKHACPNCERRSYRKVMDGDWVAALECRSCGTQFIPGQGIIAPAIEDPALEEIEETNPPPQPAGGPPVPPATKPAQLPSLPSLNHLSVDQVGMTFAAGLVDLAQDVQREFEGGDGSPFEKVQRIGKRFMARETVRVVNTVTRKK